MKRLLALMSLTVALSACADFPPREDSGLLDATLNGNQTDMEVEVVNPIEVTPLSDGPTELPKLEEDDE